MLFFNDFVKKIENSNEKLKDKERFGLESTQKIGKLGIIIPVLAIAIYWTVLGILNEPIKYSNIIVGIVILIMGLFQLRSFLSYGISIDRVNKTIKSKEIDLSCNDIQQCTLEEMGFKRGVRPALNILYKDKDLTKKLLIPLIMNKKERFVLYFKDMLADRFTKKK